MNDLRIYDIKGKQYYRKFNKFLKLNKYIETDKKYNDKPIYIYNGLFFVKDLNNVFCKVNVGGVQLFRFLSFNVKPYNFQSLELSFIDSESEHSFLKTNLVNFLEKLPNKNQKVREDFIKQEFEFLKTKFTNKINEINSLIDNLNKKVIDYYENESNMNIHSYMQDFKYIIDKYNSSIIEKFKIFDINNKYNEYFTNYLMIHFKLYHNKKLPIDITNSKKSYLNAIQTAIYTSDKEVFKEVFKSFLK